MEPEKHHNTPSVSPRPYFWLRDYILEDNKCFIPFKTKDYHYLVRVRRFKVAAEFLIRINDKFFEAKVESINKEQGLVLNVRDETYTNTYTTNRIIAMAMIDHHRLDLAIEKLTELGCPKLILVKTDYSQALNLELFNRKLGHWQALSQAACMQCGRINILDIEYQSSLMALYKEYTDLIVLDYNLWSLPGLPNSKVALIGPEGGFSSQEREWMHSIKLKAFKISENILRSETAAMLLAGHKII